MADISRVFSPVVVLPTGDIRPLSSGRIRSASSKRLPSGNPVESSRVSSAVSTIQNERNVHSQYLNDDIQDSSIIDTEIKQELSTPFNGIDLLGVINDKISKLDQALRSVEAPSDFKKNQALLTSERLRVDAVNNGKAKQQVQQFAGLLAIKSTFQDQILTTVKPKNNVKTATEQDQSTLLEIFQYPGFEENRITPLPFDVSLSVEVMPKVLPKRYVHARHPPHVKSLIELYYSPPTEALVMDIFWWIFLEFYQNQPKIQNKLLDRASTSYVSLLMMEIDLRYRDRCFQVYPSLLAETVFACYKVCFPASIKQMPIDAEAAGKSEAENPDTRLDLGNLADTPGQRMKELVNLDKFKNSISNICQLWLGGIPAPPRRYESWRSKIVQQEKINFVEPVGVGTGSTTNTSTTGASSSNTSGHQTNSRVSHRVGSHASHANQLKESSLDSSRANVPPELLKLNKRKKPDDILNDMYKHTHEPLPDRRVQYEDYLFDINGYSPLTERFLRSSHMLRRSGTQNFIPHPQIVQMPSVSSESYESDVKRAAKICRLLRAQKNLERDQEKERRIRMMSRPRIVTSKTREEFEKEEKKQSIYRRRLFARSMVTNDTIISSIEIGSASNHSIRTQY